MKRDLSIVVLIVLGTTTLALAAQAIRKPSLREQVRQHGDIEVLVINEYSPATLEELVANADTVLEGRIQRVHSWLDENETEVSTDNTVIIDYVLTSSLSQPLSPGDTIVVRRPSGLVEIEGHSVRARENDFPAFDVGERYVLFLKHQGDSFTVFSGGQGAFSIEAGTVRQVSKAFGKWNEERGVVSLPAFREEVQRHALHRRPDNEGGKLQAGRAASPVRSTNLRSRLPTRA